MISFLVPDGHKQPDRPQRTAHTRDSQYLDQGRGVDTDAVYHSSVLLTCSACEHLMVLQYIVSLQNVYLHMV